MRWVVRAVAVVVLVQSRCAVGTRNLVPFPEADFQCPANARYKTVAHDEQTVIWTGVAASRPQVLPMVSLLRGQDGLATQGRDALATKKTIANPSSRSGGPLRRTLPRAGGLHGQLLVNEPILRAGTFDWQNLLFWDPVRNRYRCHFRDFREGRRDIKIASSQDFGRPALCGADLSAFGLRTPPAVHG